MNPRLLKIPLSAVRSCEMKAESVTNISEGPEIVGILCRKMDLKQQKVQQFYPKKESCHCTGSWRIFNLTTLLVRKSKVRMGFKTSNFQNNKSIESESSMRRFNVQGRSDCRVHPNQQTSEKIKIEARAIFVSSLHHFLALIGLVKMLLSYASLYILLKLQNMHLKYGSPVYSTWQGREQNELPVVTGFLLGVPERAVVPRGSKISYFLKSLC